MSNTEGCLDPNFANKKRPGRPRVHEGPTSTLAIRGESDTIATIRSLVARGVLLSKMSLTDAQVLEQAMSEYVEARSDHRNCANKNAPASVELTGDPQWPAKTKAKLDELDARADQRRQRRAAIMGRAS